MNALRYIKSEPDYSVGKDNVISRAEVVLNEVIVDSSDNPNNSSDSITSGIEKATELILWQISKLNQMQKDALDGILKAECQVSTDLERLHLLGSRFINPADPQAAKLKEQLNILWEKRKRIEMDFFDRQCKCLEKLVSLVGRHKLVKS